MASAGKTLQFTNDSKKTEKRGNIKKMTLTAMLAAIAVILMYMEIPVPFMPGFIKLDISDLPALFGSFIYGPLCGVFKMYFIHLQLIRCLSVRFQILY